MVRDDKKKYCEQLISSCHFPQKLAMSNTAKLELLGESLYTEKMITLMAMAVVTFLCGMLPLKLFTQLRHNSDPASRTWWKSFISLCSCFSGGVFIAACLLDLLPDVEEKISEVG